MFIYITQPPSARTLSPVTILYEFILPEPPSELHTLPNTPAPKTFDYRDDPTTSGDGCASLVFGRFPLICMELISPTYYSVKNVGYGRQCI